MIFLPTLLSLKEVLKMPKKRWQMFSVYIKESGHPSEPEGRTRIFDSFADFLNEFNIQPGEVVPYHTRNGSFSFYIEMKFLIYTEIDLPHTGLVL